MRPAQPNNRQPSLCTTPLIHITTSRPRAQIAVRVLIPTTLSAEKECPMSARVFLPLFLALSVCVSGLAADAKKEASKEKPSSFDQFKQLAGEWTGKAADGKDEHEVAVTYKVTSAGSAVVETIMPGTDHEM